MGLPTHVFADGVIHALMAIRQLPVAAVLIGVDRRVMTSAPRDKVMQRLRGGVLDYGRADFLRAAVLGARNNRHPCAVIRSFLSFVLAAILVLAANIGLVYFDRSREQVGFVLECFA